MIIIIMMVMLINIDMIVLMMIKMTMKMMVIVEMSESGENSVNQAREHGCLAVYKYNRAMYNTLNQGWFIFLFLAGSL